MKQLISLIAFALVGAGMFLAGYAFHTYPPAAPAPASCAYAGDRMPSGDAIRTDTREEDVCTDGTWVAVTSYGNKR